ncbi:MAG: PTPA-CTERM sorting domain-containing protein [Solirubrobacterales bacterium]
MGHRVRVGQPRGCHSADPGAVLPGFLGLGAAGLKRRKRA